MADTTRIGIIGDYNPQNPTHVATNNGIQHASEVLGKPLEAVWLATDRPQDFENYHGLFGSPGSGPLSATPGRSCWPASGTRGKTTFRSWELAAASNIW